MAGGLCGWSSDSGGGGRRDGAGSGVGAVAHADRFRFKFSSEWEEVCRGWGDFLNVSGFPEDSLGFE